MKRDINYWLNARDKPGLLIALIKALAGKIEVVIGDYFHNECISVGPGVPRELLDNLIAKAFGFPKFYGRNMDAWIDCMSYLDDPEAGMSSVICDEGDYVVLDLKNVREFKQRCPEQYNTLIECSSFVNSRRIEAGELPLLMLSFDD